jgi:hypothetical protein
MGFFALRDIETDDIGELILENGDLKLASNRRTAIQLFDFIVKTNHGEYTPAPLVCGNLAEFIGSPNIRRTHNLMRLNAFEGLRLQGVFTTSDVQLEIEPIDASIAGMVARLRLQFDTDGATIVLAYQYPYPDGAITALEFS